MTCMQWQSGIHLLTASIYPSLNAYRWMRTTWLKSWQSSQDERRFLSAVRADDFLKRHFSKTSFFNSVLFLFCDLPPTSVLLKSPFSFCTFPQGSFLVTFFFFFGRGDGFSIKNIYFRMFSEPEQGFPETWTSHRSALLCSLWKENALLRRWLPFALQSNDSCDVKLARAILILTVALGSVLIALIKASPSSITEGHPSFRQLLQGMLGDSGGTQLVQGCPATPRPVLWWFTITLDNSPYGGIYLFMKAC